MKELKGIDENTVIELSSTEEDQKVREILNNSGVTDWISIGKVIDYSEGLDVPYLKVIKGKLSCSSGSSDYETVIKAAEFIRLNTEPETPAIPEKWYVKRTPENAEVLNAWEKAKIPYVGEVYEFIFWTGESHVNYDWYGSIPEITFEQWQTIPEHAEWLKDYDTHKFIEAQEKVEEREIIGYEAPCDIPEWETEKGDIWVKHDKFDCYKSQSKSVNLPKEWVETWSPVYREIEKPVFEEGKYATFENAKTFRIASIEKDNVGRIWLVNEHGGKYLSNSCRHATPEEIEAARPKRKYMKQVWYVLVMDENFNSLLVSKQHETEEQAHQWTLENSEEGRVYSIKPFEVVAYE